ncbi:MAG TPA: 5-deoxy-glucuronate isomerase [Candidatus Binatia bacterium]|nr:5-deoxy-glucuronate isomerase [Candidatus Binatia bacterium]
MTGPLTSPAAEPAVRRISVVKAGEQARYITLETISAQRGARIELASGQERLAVVMTGRVRVSTDGHRELGTAGCRDSVFDGPGDAVYLPPGVGAGLVVEDEAGVAVASAAAGPLEPGPPRIIRAAEQRVATVGRTSWQRSVRTILGPDDAASRLLVGETINEPGRWSSYPPHRHDRESADEVALEEVYLYRVSPSDGFGVQVRYDSDENREARVVRDGDVSVIRSGFHPVVAAPGYRLYYLWIMAGEGRVTRGYIDPRYRWIEAAP